jgi:hypothetical protein
MKYLLLVAALLLGAGRAARGQGGGADCSRLRAAIYAPLGKRGTCPMNDDATPISLAALNALSRQAYTIGYLRGALKGLLLLPYVKQSPSLVEQIEQVLAETMERTP